MENEARSEAQQALSEIADARADLARRLVTPWWYHPARGFLLAGYVAIASTALFTEVLLAMVVFAVGVVSLVAFYKSRTGMAPRLRWRSGRSNVLLTIIYLVCAFVALAAGRLWGLPWLSLILAAVIFVSTIVIGRRHDNSLDACADAGTSTE